MKKVVIENEYEFDSMDDDGCLSYGFNIVRDSIEGNKSSKWSGYNTKDDRFYFSFGRNINLDALGKHIFNFFKK